MPGLSLVLYAIFIAITFGLRTAIQLRRTGSSGFNGIGGRPGSLEWLAGVGFVVAVVLGFMAPVLALTGTVEPIAALAGTAGYVIGTTVAVLGIALTFAAQTNMGRSWRIGVDPSEHTELVTGGLFALVRNPIYSGMIPAAFGLLLLVPSWPAIAGFAGLVTAIELQVRVVEEPHLFKAHGDTYAEYAAQVGRFVPGLGRL